MQLLSGISGESSSASRLERSRQIQKEYEQILWTRTGSSPRRLDMAARSTVGSSRHMMFGRDVFLLGWMGRPVPEPDLSDWQGHSGKNNF